VSKSHQTENDHFLSFLLCLSNFLSVNRPIKLWLLQAFELLDWKCSTVKWSQRAWLSCWNRKHKCSLFGGKKKKKGKTQQLLTVEVEQFLLVICRERRSIFYLKLKRSKGSYIIPFFSWKSRKHQFFKEKFRVNSPAKLSRGIIYWMSHFILISPSCENVGIFAQSDDASS